MTFHPPAFNQGFPMTSSSFQISAFGSEPGGGPAGQPEITEVDFAGTDGISGGEYLLVYDASGSVAIWFNRDGSGSSPVAGDRQIGVGFGLEGSDEDRANDFCLNVGLDGAWTCSVSGTVVTMTDVANGARTDATPETSLTNITVIQQGA